MICNVGQVCCRIGFQNWFVVSGLPAAGYSFQRSFVTSVISAVEIYRGRLEFERCSVVLAIPVPG